MKYSAIILDMDGVVWLGSQWLIDPPGLFGRLRAAGIRYAMATNNATRSVQDYLTRFADAGVSLEPWQIINSAAATATYLAGEYPEGGELFVVGESGLETALLAKGFTLGDRQPLAVVCGLDRHVNYEKLKTATLAIRAGARFIGTNPDKSLPTPEGEAPGAGALLAAIEAATKISPEIIGKPETTMFRQLLSLLQAAPEEVLIVGDRLETDIAGGQALGCDTACVLTGVSTRSAAQAWRPAVTRIVPDLNTLVAQLVADK